MDYSSMRGVVEAIDSLGHLGTQGSTPRSARAVVELAPRLNLGSISSESSWVLHRDLTSNLEDRIPETELISKIGGNFAKNASLSARDSTL
jgi:hypothetical protein